MSDTAEKPSTEQFATAFEQGYKAAQEDARVIYAEIERLRLATNEGSLAKRADRIWEIVCQMQGRPITGAKQFLG